MYSTKNHNTQINVTGWKLVESGTLNNSTGSYNLYYNGKGLCNLYAQGQATIQGSGYGTTLVTFNNEYRPLNSPVISHGGNSKGTSQYLAIWNNQFSVFNTDSVGSITIEFNAVWICNY